jgi:hypothetical protein
MRAQSVTQRTPLPPPTFNAFDGDGFDRLWGKCSLLASKPEGEETTAILSFEGGGRSPEVRYVVTTVPVSMTEIAVGESVISKSSFEFDSEERAFWVFERREGWRSMLFPPGMNSSESPDALGLAGR